MATFSLIVLVLCTLAYNTDALSCINCVYADVPDDVVSAFPSEFLDVKCKDGGPSGSNMTSSEVCEEPDTGSKAVCIQGTADITWTPTGANATDLEVKLYVRGCESVAADKPDEGSIPSDDIKIMAEDLLNDFVPGQAKSFSGNAVYCSTDDCGADKDLTKLSGVAAIFPSMLLVSVLSLLTGFF